MDCQQKSGKQRGPVYWLQTKTLWPSFPQNSYFFILKCFGLRLDKMKIVPT